jgi:hypothetical protein
LEQTAAYLTALTGEVDPTVTFQTFDDVKDRADPRLIKVTHGRLSEQTETLALLNQKGAGIFVMVNEGDGNGRCAKNVRRVRSLFIDDDETRSRDYAVSPSFIVQSSPKREHAYFLVDGDVPLEDFTPAQKHLAGYYKTDNVSDLPRVLRLPGFFHNKRAPILVTFKPGAGRKYTLREILDAHPVKEEKPEPPEEETRRTSTSESRETQIELVLDAAQRHDWKPGHRHNSAKTTASHARKLGLELGEIVSIVAECLVTAGRTRAEAEREATELGKWVMKEVEPERMAPNTPRAYHEEPFPEPLAPEAFYGLVGELVQIVGPQTEADLPALSAQFLAYYGNALGRRSYYSVGAARHYPVEFITLVGETSVARKGTSEAEVRRPFLLSNNLWTKRISTGLSSGEGLIHSVRDPVQKMKAVREKGRPLTYRAVVVDEGIPDKRLLVIETELGRVLRVMDREGNTLSATLREAWDCRSLLQILTKNSPATATNAHISVVGHITKAELVRHLDRTEAANGFGNRFLWIAVRRSKFLPDGGSLTDSDLSAFAAKLSDRLRMASAVEEMHRDDDARAMWHAEYPRLTSGRYGLLGAVTGRAEAHVLRLSMIYALTDGSGVIGAQHLSAALAVWKYAEDSARFIFGDATGDPEADEILRALRRAGSAGLTREAIGNIFYRHVSSRRISGALALLARQGQAHLKTETGTGGRNAERWICGADTCAESEESSKTTSTA